MIYFGKTRINLFSYDASAKPRLDTEEILKGMGFTPLIVSAFEEVKDVNLRVEQELANIKENDIIIVQYPSFSCREYEIAFNKQAHKQGAKVLGIVHDLESLRWPGDTADFEVLNTFDAISLPSNKAANFLVKKGLKIPFYFQFFWDYLCENNGKMLDVNADVIYAGNICKAKTEFLDDVNFPLRLYGDNVDKRVFNENISYQGPRMNEELILEIGGNIGLSWDSNNYLKYTEYNLSYKPAMYLAANCPIIVPKKANIARIVEAYNLGKVIGDLKYDTVLKAVVDIKKEREKYAEATLAFGETLRNGKNMTNLIERMLTSQDAY